MGFTEAVIYILIGGGAGILSGMFGIGGGILIVPSIILLTGMNLKEAYGTSLAALLLPVGIFGCIVYYKKKLLDIKTALIIAAGIMCTIGFGAYLANILDLVVLKISYSIFLFYIGLKFIKPLRLLRMAVSKSKVEAAENEPLSTQHVNFSTTRLNNKSSYIKCFIIGALAGINAGFFGVGGGAIIVPLLTLWLSFDPKRAIATSLGVLLPPIGLPGVMVYYGAGNLNFEVATYVAIGLLLGTIFGAKITVRLPVGLIKSAYGVLLIITGIKFTLNI